ncbi:MAG: hypothetical protein E7294_09415 [Lachnospiraceae bacterium]|nr:hypothetical protein [Lachnospiraceae bacterium]
MHSIKEIQLKCNKQFIVYFDGGELSSAGGLLMIKEFLHALGFEKLLRNSFKTNDTAMFRIHTDDKNLLQMIYQIFGTYYEDNCADELQKDPLLITADSSPGYHMIVRIPLTASSVLIKQTTGKVCRNS